MHTYIYWKYDNDDTVCGRAYIYNYNYTQKNYNYYNNYSSFAVLVLCQYSH